LETTFTPVSAAVGGALIGLSAVLLMATLGRIAGISGILGAAIRSTGGQRAGWQWAFLAGLVVSAAVVNTALGGWVTPREGFPVWALVLAGLLVGFGTALGNGCTSGHGVCGLSRLSPRSLVATVVFMVFGVGAATLLRATVLA
jgi:uncharacterized membrane protein YedE/YeeE